MFTAKKTAKTQADAQWGQDMSAKILELIRENEGLLKKFNEKVKDLLPAGDKAQSSLRHRNQLAAISNRLMQTKEAQAALQKLGRKEQYMKSELVAFIHGMLDAMPAVLTQSDEEKSDTTKTFMSSQAKSSSFIQQSMQALSDIFGSCGLGKMLMCVSPAAAAAEDMVTVTGDLGCIACIIGCCCFAYCCYRNCSDDEDHHHSIHSGVTYTQVPNPNTTMSGHHGGGSFAGIHHLPHRGGTGVTNLFFVADAGDQTEFDAESYQRGGAHSITHHSSLHGNHEDVVVRIGSGPSSSASAPPPYQPL